MKYILILLLLVANTSFADPFKTGNVDYGKALFAEYSCSDCHRTKFGGDGNQIFTNGDRKVHTAANLTQQIGVCSNRLKANLNAQEIQDLGAYLNKKYYYF